MLQVDTLHHQVKPPMPGMYYTLLNHWPRDQKETTTTTPCKHHRLFPLLFYTTWWWGPIAENSICLCHWTRRSQAGAQLEASPYCAGRCSAYYQRRNVISDIIQLQTLWPTTATCLQDMLLQSWHKCYGFKWFKTNFVSRKVIKWPRTWD